MKTKFIPFVLLLFLYSGCSSRNTSPQPINLAAPTNAIQYFGFVAIDCAYDDPTDSEIKTNYIDEVSNFTNIGHLCIFEPEDDLTNRLNAFDSAGMKALLHIETVLFAHEVDSKLESGFRTLLHPQAEARWTVFMDNNRHLLTKNLIAALYVVDEPVWHGLSIESFNQALSIIKNDLPTIPTMAVEAYPVLDQLIVPPQLDWIGFDNYNPADPFRDLDWQNDLEILSAARSNPNQKIVIIASTQWLPSYRRAAGITPQDMPSVIESYYQVASTYPDVIAMIGYLWPGGLDHPAQLGARNLPENTKKALQGIGRYILEN